MRMADGALRHRHRFGQSLLGNFSRSVMVNILSTRRDLLRSVVGLTGLTLPTFLQLRAEAPVARKAKSCIILYCWGGISHYESWDPKPDAPTEIRGEFKPIATATPGIQLCEYLPGLAKHTGKLAIIRSVYHNQGGHQQGLYVSMTGHQPPGGVKARAPDNWPSLAAMIARFNPQAAGGIRAVRLPYPMYDNGTLMAGEYGGWLGSDHDPVLMRTPAGEPYGGVSRYTEPSLDLTLTLERSRFDERSNLLDQFDRDGVHARGAETDFEQLVHYRQMALDLLTDSPIRQAYDLTREEPSVRKMYGDHIGGQSMLLARRLTEAGVPVVQVCCGAGDLAGGGGDNWDTHKDHFKKMKDRLLPVFDRSVSALLTDLEQRGRLEETLVVFLTDFGRTPKINNNAGRDHHPAVYSVVLAGGGIRGGQVYGSSDDKGAKPGTNPCTPADVHATVFTALGISPRAHLKDHLGRPFAICDGAPLPLC